MRVDACIVLTTDETYQNFAAHHSISLNIENNILYGCDFALSFRFPTPRLDVQKTMEHAALAAINRGFYPFR